MFYRWPKTQALPNQTITSKNTLTFKSEDLQRIVYSLTAALVCGKHRP